jgi:uncharacterized protein (DUF3084 family)
MFPESAINSNARA